MSLRHRWHTRWKPHAVFCGQCGCRKDCWCDLGMDHIAEAGSQCPDDEYEPDDDPGVW